MRTDPRRASPVMYWPYAAWASAYSRAFWEFRNGRSTLPYWYFLEDRLKV